MEQALPLTNCIAKLIGHGELMGHGFIQSPMFNLKYQLTLFLEQFPIRPQDVINIIKG